MMRSALFVLIGCTAVLGRLHLEFLEVAGALKSQARETFHSDEEFIAKAHEFQTLARDTTSKSDRRSHPIVIKLEDTCDSSHRALLSKKFGESAVTHINQDFTIVSATAAELEEFASTTPNVIKYQMSMLPEMKVDKET